MLAMHLLSGSLSGLTNTVLAAPAPSSSPGALGLQDNTQIDNSTFCTTHYPALSNAISHLCARDNLLIGNNWTISESADEYKHSPHPASIIIQGACASETTGPPEHVTEICLGIAFDLCRARIEYGRGVVLNRGKADCQLWFIPGWDEENFSGYDWDDLEILRMGDLSAPG